MSAPTARRTLLGAALAVAGILLPAAAAHDVSGAEKQAKIPAGGLARIGCLADESSLDVKEKLCARAFGLRNAAFLALSPDGRFVYITGRDSDSITVFRRAARTGRLTQLSGAAGCVVDKGMTFPGCVDTGSGLDRASGITLSPDGRHIYVAGNYSSSIVTFARDAGSGAVRQMGCVSDMDVAPEPNCAQTGKGLKGANYLTVSPDGRHVYAASATSDAVAIFARDAATGALTQAGCLTNLGSDRNCTSSRGLDGASAVAVSRDGRNVYVAARDSSALTTFQRDPATGALTLLGCISGDRGYRQDRNCSRGRGLQFVQFVSISPDQRHVYASATDAHVVGIFARDPAKGTLRQLPGKAGCLLDAGYEGPPCQRARGIALPLGMTWTADGRYLYMAGFGYGSVTAFARNPKTGALNQIGKCISYDDPRCPGTRGLMRAGFLALAPDARHVYVNAPVSNSVTIFRRVGR